MYIIYCRYDFFADKISWTLTTKNHFIINYFVIVYRRDQAASRPKLEFVPKTLNDLHPVDVIADDINGKFFEHLHFFCFNYIITILIQTIYIIV